MPSIYAGSDLMDKIQEEKSRLSRELGESDEADVYVTDRQALRELLDPDVRKDLGPLNGDGDGG